MRQRNSLVIIIGFLCALLVFSCEKTENNEEIAKAKFSRATSKLYETGGIATFEVPQGQSAFRPLKDEKLSPSQIDQILKESIKDLKEAIKLDPSLKEAHYFLGIAYLKLQDTNNAIKSFKNAIKVESQKEISYLFLCSLLIETNNFKEAHRVANKYLQEFPEKKINMLDLIALAYYKEGDYANAIKKGNEIVSIDNRHIGGHLLLAQAYYMMGDKENSERQFKKVIELDSKMRKKVENIKASLNATATELGK